MVLGLFFVSNLGHLAFAYPIHDLDYANSSYQNKKTPSLGKPVDFLYQIGNYGDKSQNSHAQVTVTNLDDQNIVYYKDYSQVIPSGKTFDILWEFTPETSGLYVVEIVENFEKHAKRFFAVPENNDNKRIPHTNPEFLEDVSPRKQFRMGMA